MSVNKARLAREILGVGAGGGALQKLRVSYQTGESSLGTVYALFNPAAIGLSKSATWQTKYSAASFAIRQDFLKVEAETLNIELFFDTYASWQVGAASPAVATAPAPASPPLPRSDRDVRNHTDKIASLADIHRELHQPPVCFLSWGNWSIFRGVLTSVQQHFTLFLEDGTPVRATLSCTFTEFDSTPRIREQEGHSADVHKTRQVRRNDSLHSLAAEEYGDPALWRHIARTNGIVNPRALTPGTVLMIPKLRT